MVLRNQYLNQYLSILFGIAIDIDRVAGIRLLIEWPAAIVYIVCRKVNKESVHLML